MTCKHEHIKRRIILHTEHVVDYEEVCTQCGSVRGVGQFSSLNPITGIEFMNETNSTTYLSDFGPVGFCVDGHKIPWHKA